MAEIPRLEVRDLVKHFPVRRGTFAKAREFVKAVNGVSLRINDGETVAIVGESGCGKSTIARLILRLERSDIGEYPPRRRRLAGDGGHHLGAPSGPTRVAEPLVGA